MSQKAQDVNETFTVELKVKVTINYFTNHNGFRNGQVEEAIQEFKDEIQKELEGKINKVHYQQDFLQTVDFVCYEVSSEIKKNKEL